MKNPSTFLLIVLFCLFFFNQTSIAQTNKRVCVMGSSSAYGNFPYTSIPNDSAWAYKLRKYYRDAGIVDFFYNIATPGIDCYAAMPSSYIPPVGRTLPNPINNITRAVNLVPKPDVIIVNFPSNGYDNLSIAEILFCLKTIKDSANANGINCFITTTQPRDDFNVAGRQKLKDLKGLIESTFGIWSIDFYTPLVVEPSLTLNPLYALGDMIHLNPLGHTILADRVKSINLFDIAFDVTFSYIKALEQNGKVLVEWHTLQEHENEKYIIEKSKDSRHFIEFSTVFTPENSYIPKTYTLIDNQPFYGENYYRIKAIGRDGKLTYSSISLARVPYKGLDEIKIYPSFAQNSIMISFRSEKKQTALISIASYSGNIFYKKRMEVVDGLIKEIDISGFLKGTYIISIEINGKVDIHRFSKVL